tara:strand:- start:87 stop:206 length:120 start_codon:yes stop_codon:yes gene_type:complete
MIVAEKVNKIIIIDEENIILKNEFIKFCFKNIPSYLFVK